MMVRTLYLLSVAVLLTSCVTVPPPTDLAEQGVRQASDRFWAALERGDAAALAAQYTDEGILMIPGLPDSVGRGAIRELLQKRLASFRVADFEIHRREIQVVGDTAHELAWYSETHHRPGDSMRMDGRFYLVWKRESDGAWRVHRNLANFSGATPVAPPSD